MPKRSADKKIQKYLKKIKKIKRKQQCYSSTSSDSETENGGTTSCQPETFLEEPFPIIEETQCELNAQQDLDILISEEGLSAEPTSAEEAISASPELDPSILEALGEVVNESPDFGEKIHESLAKLWTPILKKGMAKYNRDSVMKNYLIPENCSLLKSPTLNPEILAAIPETGRFRDKKISNSQQQLGVAITAVNRGLPGHSLLTEDKKILAIKYISDGCRLLSDLHFQNTETRKKFITPGLDKSFLQLIQVVDRDETLFGKDLSEKIKASKAISSQSQQIKKAALAPKPVHTLTRNFNQGNWQGPPRFSSNRGGRGGTRRFNQRVPHQPAPTIPVQTQAKITTRTRGAVPRHLQHP